MNQLAIFFIQFVSNFFKAMGVRGCRFYPSCSCYAREAFQKYSFMKASSLTTHRLLKCQPFSHGGYDPLIKES